MDPVIELLQPDHDRLVVSDPNKRLSAAIEDFQEAKSMVGINDFCDL